LAWKNLSEDEKKAYQQKATELRASEEARRKMIIIEDSQSHDQALGDGEGSLFYEEDCEEASGNESMNIDETEMALDFASSPSAHPSLPASPASSCFSASSSSSLPVQLPQPFEPLPPLFDLDFDFDAFIFDED